MPTKQKHRKRKAGQVTTDAAAPVTYELPPLSGWGELYLEETGLSAEEALEAVELEAFLAGRTASLVDLRRFPEEERSDLKAAYNLLIALNELVLRVGVQMPAEERPPLRSGDKELVWPRPNREEEDLERLRRFVTEEQVEAARGLVARKLEESGVVDLGFDSPASAHLELPGAREARSSYNRLTEKAAITPEQAQARLDELLVDRPSLSKWLEERGQEDRFGWARRELEDLIRDELARTRRDLEEKERRLREREQLLERDLPATTRYSQMLLDNVLATREDWQKQHKRQLSLFNKGELAEGEPGGLLEQEARLDVEPTYWNLSTPEWRLLHAVNTLYTAEGLDGDTYRREYVPEDWPRLYAAAGLPENVDARGWRGDYSHKRREDLLEAMESLASDPRRPGSGRRVPVFISRKQANGKWTILAQEMCILERLPWWTDRSDEEAETLRRQPPDTWPEPDGWALRSPRALRAGLDNYFREIPTTLWHRLEEAAGQVQSRSRGVQRRDWSFALWLYKRKPQRREEDGTLRFVVHVDVDDLAKRIPALRTYLEARQKKRLRSYLTQTYDITRQAGLLLDYELDVATSRGVRDVLTLNPEMFPQLAGDRRRALQAGLELGEAGT